MKINFARVFHCLGGCREINEMGVITEFSEESLKLRRKLKKHYQSKNEIAFV